MEKSSPFWQLRNEPHNADTTIIYNRISCLKHVYFLFFFFVIFFTILISACLRFCQNEIGEIKLSDSEEPNRQNERQKVRSAWNEAKEEEINNYSINSIKTDN